MTPQRQILEKIHAELKCAVRSTAIRKKRAARVHLNIAGALLFAVRASTDDEIFAVVCDGLGITVQNAIALIELSRDGEPLSPATLEA